jgi:hypothetical protein
MRLHYSLLQAGLAVALTLGFSACDDTTAPGRSLAGSAATRSSGAIETIFGPERFMRSNRAPAVETRAISTAGFEAPFILHVVSGDAEGNHRVSSATVSLDGHPLLGPASFKQSQHEWVIPVAPGEPAALSVSIAGAPGDYLEVSMSGQRSSTVFCPDGHPGSIADFQAALDQTPAGGTLLVCDGEHAVTGTINKPLTLRSQHPGGATLSDADIDPAPGQISNPIIQILDVPVGDVRLVDIGIRVADVGVRPTANFGHVELDSVRFTGPGVAGASSSIALRSNRNTVAGARVDVTRSSFENLGLGVWPIGNVETNVSHSTFAHFGGGAVDLSNSSLPDQESFGRVEDNQFSDCSPTGCIRILTTGAVTVARNRFEGFTQPITLGVIVMTPPSGVGASGQKIIEDNEIISAPTGASPSTPGGWIVQTAINIGDASGTKHTIQRNRIVDAYSAMQLNANVEAHDNVITGGVFAFRQGSVRSVRFQRNDIVGSLSSFTGPTFASQYQCNWWGSPAGPMTPPAGVPSFAYTPVATQPIANSTVDCDPSAGGGTIRVCSTPGSTRTVATLADAVAQVATGGTIQICDGVHAAAGVVVNRPMSIESEGPGIATLDGGAATSALTITGLPSFGSQLQLAALRFVGGQDANVIIGDNARSLTIRNVEFHPPETAPYGGERGLKAGVSMGGVGISSITVQSNTFVGGDVGYLVNSVSGSNFLSTNLFTGQANAAIYIAGPQQVSMTVSSNDFRDCGPDWCVFSQQPLTFSGNDISIDITRPTVSPLTIASAFPGTSLINSNTIVGTGSGGSDRSEQSTYPIRSHAIHVVGSATVSTNTITNAFTGLGPTPAAITGENNTIQRTFAPFSGGGSPGGNSLQIRRSDLTDYVQPVSNPGTFGSLDLHCNYWGAATGATNIPGGFEASFTPFSPVPISRRAAVVCTP